MQQTAVTKSSMWEKTFNLGVSSLQVIAEKADWPTQKLLSFFADLMSIHLQIILDTTLLFTVQFIHLLEPIPAVLGRMERWEGLH